MQRGVASVVVAGLAALTGLAPTPSPTKAAGTAWDLPGADKQIADFQERAKAAGAAGFYRDDPTDALVVLVPADQRGSMNLSVLGSPGVPVRFKSSVVNSSDLANARKRLTDVVDQPFASGKSMGYFFNAQTEKFEVTTSIGKENLAAALGDSWPLVDYREGGIEVATRFNDSPAFWGGAAYRFEGPEGDPYYDCTTGFTVVNGSGRRGLVTAAHCAPVNTNVLTPPGTALGKTELKFCGTGASGGGNADVQLIATKSYTYSIYIGNVNGTRADVREAGTPGVGSSYYYSGATTYENGQQKVLSIDGSYWANSGFCNQTFWVLNLIVWNRSGVCDVRGGDSGAPFYTKYGGTPPQVGIRGMVTAHTTNNTTCYGMKYTRIRDLLGYSILTL